MSRIVHIVLKVENLEETTKFYRQVFGFTEQSTKKVRDHTSRHLSDGDITARGRLAGAAGVEIAVVGP